MLNGESDDKETATSALRAQSPSVLLLNTAGIDLLTVYKHPYGGGQQQLSVWA